ncbi:hypothetical protein HHI36_019624 [Cryptolaemus montrouzieri]|uniref:Uncharacterized protein n=1 Tax=Cryptolaemus montrouzieri TaxID=559131 RepID=A0ABD2N9E4_9CUCU
MSSMDFKKKHSIATVNTSMRIEKPIQTHGKLFRNSSLSEKIPPPIIEVTVEDDNSSLDHVEHKDSSVTTIKYEKELDDRERRKYSNKSVDSRTRNSVASATTSSGQEDDENVNRLSIRNDLTRSNSAGNSIRSSTRCSSVQSLSNHRIHHGKKSPKEVQPLPYLRT